VSAEAVRKALTAFEPLPHRMALVGELQGVRFFDDSKGPTSAPPSRPCAA
jgi:UDP-N-acetylmuramoylalanine-D-glutamate ligase